MTTSSRVAVVYRLRVYLWGLVTYPVTVDRDTVYDSELSAEIAARMALAENPSVGRIEILKVTGTEEVRVKVIHA